MTAIDKETRRLRAIWEAARLTKERSNTDAAILAEQEAWDALIDHVEANDLAYTVHDPRGPREPEE